MAQSAALSTDQWVARGPTSVLVALVPGKLGPVPEEGDWRRPRGNGRVRPPAPPLRPRRRWIRWTVLGVALVMVGVVGNEWHTGREAARLEEQAFDVIDSLELPLWMIEVERDEVGFHCHFWSGCQERFVSVVYELDANKASAADRANPCAALIAAFRDWVIEHAPTDRCEVSAALNGSSVAGGVFEDGLAPLPRGAALDDAERAQLWVYV